MDESGFSSWMKKIGVGAIGALGVALAVLASGWKRTPKELPKPVAPNDTQLDSNIDDIQERQKQLDSAHTQIEDVLKPKPKPNSDLTDAVKEWNQK